MKRIHLLVALAGLALALPLAATSANAQPHQPAERLAARGDRDQGQQLLRRLDPDRPCLEGQPPHRPGRRARPRPRATGDRRRGRPPEPALGRRGPTGDGYVYNASTGADIAQFNFTDATSFVNDVVTKRAAWFTDSMRQFLYKVPIGANGELGTPQAVPLTGDIVYQSGFNVNGIDATPNGKKLGIVQSNTGKLFKVNRDGVARLINLGGATVTGDGLLLHGKRLYAVVRSPVDGVMGDQAAAELLLSGTVVRTITNSDLDDSDDHRHARSRLYAVNARFSTPPGLDVEYWVTQLRR